MKIDDEAYSETKVTKLIQFEGKSEITSSYRISNLGQENEASEAFIMSFVHGCVKSTVIERRQHQLGRMADFSPPVTFSVYHMHGHEQQWVSI